MRTFYRRKMELVMPKSKELRNLQKFNLVIAIDQNYERYAELLIHDIWQAIGGRMKMHLTLITFADFQGLKLANLARQLKIDFNHWMVDLNLEGVQFLDHGHITKSAYLKFFIGNASPKGFKFCLYVDPDVLVTGDPLQFFEFLPSSILSAWTHPKLYSIISRDSAERVPGFSSGLMLINLQAWRSQSLTCKLLEVLKDYPQEPDGDIFNLAFAQYKLEWERLPAFLHQIRELESVAEVGGKSPVIVHFEGASKPWNTPFGGKYEREWRKRFRKIYPNFKISLPLYINFFMNSAVNFTHWFFLKNLVRLKQKNYFH
jgi:lipopolysaccharide biosynthesis glycosyltransferase